VLQRKWKRHLDCSASNGGDHLRFGLVDDRRGGNATAAVMLAHGLKLRVW